MAIVQISKLQQRSGNLVDLPQLDEAELGFASDAKLLFVGKESPTENIEILTSYSNISFSQIEGSVGNLNIDSANLANGQVLTYTGTEWTNRGGDEGGLITLGDVSNVKITGGAIGYVLETDGTGNLAWTPKGTITALIQQVTNANPAVVTTTEDNFFVAQSAVTFTNLPGVSGSVGNSLNGQTLYANILTSNSFSLYTDIALTTSYNATGNTAFPYTSVTATSSSTDRVTVGDATAFTLNDPVIFIGNTDQSNSNIISGQTYYVLTKDTVAPNTFITLSETISGSTLQLGTSTITANVYSTGGRALSAISTGGGGTGSPGGVANTVQYNDGVGGFAGSSNFTFNSGTNLLTLSGNANVGNLNATGSVTSSLLVSNIAIGTAPLTVTSTTRVSNLNVAYANVSDFGVVTAQTTGTFFPVLVNGSATANRALAANANLGFNVATGNLSATILYSNSTITAVGNIVGSNVDTAGNVTASRLISNVSTGTAPLTVSSTTRVANLNVNYANVSDFNVITTQTTGTFYPSFVNGSTTGNFALASNSSLSFNAATGALSATLLTGTLTTAAQPNVTSVSTSFTNLTFDNAQTISGNNITLTTGSTSNTGTITGNWSLSAGSRLQATYADLAEYYSADTIYPPGTVLEFGGDAEVTLASDGSNKVAGVVSTDPAYAMNAKCPGIATAIALQGRVPCKVRGEIKKGDMMVSGGNGYARPSNSPQIGTVIGKSLVDFSGVEGVIEIAVGRV